MVSPTNRSRITWTDSAMPSTQARHDRFNRAQQMGYERWLGEKDSCRIKFMPQSNQEYTARRFQSFDSENPAPVGPRYGAAYDCELPPQRADRVRCAEAYTHTRP